MGASGKRWAQENFEWSRVITSYETLWQDLARRRASETVANFRSTSAPNHPSRPDPFKMFAGFPTKPINLDGSVTFVETAWPVILQRIQLKLGLVQADVLIDIQELPGLIGELEAQNKINLRDLADGLGIKDSSDFLVTVGWLAKLGLCHYAPPDPLNLIPIDNNLSRTETGKLK